MGRPVEHPRLLCEPHRQARTREQTRLRVLRHRTDDTVRTIQLPPTETLALIDALAEAQRAHERLADQLATGDVTTGGINAHLTASRALYAQAAQALAPVLEDLARRQAEQEPQ